MSEVIWSFPPVADAGATVLILGTMPSEASLQEGFYYAHPRNCFWPMIAEILGEARPGSVDEKRAMLLRHNIALWDVARSCIRPGSMDSDIRCAVPNDIGKLLRGCPDIDLVLLNGGTADRLYRKLLPELNHGPRAVRVPSTSPAYTLSYESKLNAWRSAMGLVDEK